MKHILITFLFISNSSHAQVDASATKDSHLQMIKVQGNKENKSYNESTESISVVPNKELDSPVQTNSVQALNALPNVTVNRPDNTFSIRGVNNTGVTGYAKDNVSSILVDDVFQTDLAVKAGSVNLWDINHAEVYRGPQSTSQGVNSLAGSILLFHNKPAEQTEGAVKLGYGSFNAQEFGVMSNNVWLNENLLSRISYNKEKNDGFIKNFTRADSKWAAQDKDHLSLDLIYKLNDADFIRINSKLMHTDNGGNFVQSNNPFDYEVREDVGFNTLTKNNQTGLRYFKKITDSWNNEIIAAYSNSRNDEYSDADRTSTNTAGTRYETHIDTLYSLENLLKYQNGDVKNVMGIHAHKFALADDDDFTILLPVGPPVLPTNIVAPVATRQKTDKNRTVLTVFDSLLYRISQKQSINLGLRYEYVINSYEAEVRARRIQNYGSSGNALADAYLAQRSGTYDKTNYNSVLLPKAAYTFEINEHTYGASISQGYRTGGISINRTQARADQYDPETTTNYELSYKFNAADIRASANAFYTNWKDQQVLVILGDQFDSQVKNAATSELYGAEFETQWNIDPKNTLGLSGGYVMTRFNDFSNGSTSYRGNEFPSAPNWTGRTFYTYNITDFWNVTGVLRYVGTSFTNVDNTRKAPEQFYLDLNTQFLLPKYNLISDLYLRNVLNSQYLLYDGRPLTTATPYQSNYHQVNTPAEIGVRLTYIW